LKTVAENCHFSYWDLPYNNFNYSYVETAVRNGYATLAIDRLGIGNSSHGDPFNEIQARAEVEALNAVTLKLRHGEIPGIKQAFKKVVHVGHSFGSIQSYWLSSLYPNNTDGLVLTGWSARGDFLPTSIGAWNFQSARLNQPFRFGNSSNEKVKAAFNDYLSGDKLVNGLHTLLQTLDVNLSTHDIWNEIATTTLGNLIAGYNLSFTIPLDYPSGYLAHSSLQGNQFVFYLPGHFDLSLALLSEYTKQPVTVGELLTIGTAPPSSSFKGPVFVFTGEQDQPFCGGDCFESETAASIPAEAAKMFPNAAKFEAYIQRNTAHGVTAHYNATAGYEVVQGWLKGNGLGPKGGYKA
jgi:pimeloyl-ACP methyl ester carboxylesterase